MKYNKIEQEYQLLNSGIYHKDQLARIRLVFVNV